MDERITEKLVDGNWESIKMKDLKIGDIFRLKDIDENGNISEDAFQNGTKNYIAEGEPFLNDEGIWSVIGNIFQEGI